MTSTLTVPQSLSTLQTVIDACRGRVEDALLDPAQAIVNRAGRRLTLAGDTTVVAIAGATGAGKSSLFNALSRTALAETGVRRPTTSQAMSMTFGQAQTGDLLTWLSVPRRHSVPGHDLSDLVLIDLPDYDSTVQRHRDEVDRLIELVDVILWVVDPQKYADAALHDRYLIPMASHAEVMIFVLNQIDRVRPEQIDRIRGDLAHLLASEGITGVDIHAVSAATGQGVDQLRRALRDVAGRKQMVAKRLVADVTAAARQLQESVALGPVRELSSQSVERLDAAIAEAAGVDEVTTAVEASWRYRGQVATGWPILAWLRRLRPDPLRRLHLTSGADPRNPAPTDVSHTSVRAWQTVPAARVDTALRTLADESVQQLPRGWQQAVQRAARSQEETLPDQLDHAIGSANLELDRKPGWWSLVKWLQILLFICFVGGLVWLILGALGRGFFGLPATPNPTLGSIPVATLFVFGGLILGVILALVARAGVLAQAKAKGVATARLLRSAITKVTQGAIVAPVNAELQRHNEARQGITLLLGR
ncbi:MAG: 50S ribosome-binding GTPase [Propionibacteriaceae bacterium]|nr:50S ribosome-binding GTPase [Propionibacteriaceae bacterium]